MAAPRADLGEEYLSHVAHELRGSLNAILGWAEFLRSGPCDDAIRVRAAETIIRHARQQSWMIGELLDTWRLAAGTLKFSAASYDLSHVIQTAVDAVQPAAREKSVRVAVEHDGTSVKTTGDSKRLAQAFTTLLYHAVHFAPNGSTVGVRVETGPGVARVSIHDDGPAVPPSALPYLFDRNRPLEAGRSSPRAIFRLGLGFVRDVIAHHDGWIGGESAGDGHGMTFRVAVPIQDGTLPVAETKSPVVAAGRRANGNLYNLRVLLVDDEPDAREALMGILQHYGATVRIAGSAAEAIAALQHEPVDVLLADIGMPGADGYDLIRYVRALDSVPAAKVPAVAVTAFASEADRRRALAAGFQMHLSKPVDPVSLVAAVAALAGPAPSVR